ncbi:MAG: hypothetical protein BroJett020_11710 [Bacteroidota bacterium]|nr:MAG: hypothetical protein BroJett020_11710 [Bacteroidota bacterium]
MKNFIIPTICIALLCVFACKKEKKENFIKPQHTSENANARFSPPERDESINNLLDSFDVDFTNYMENTILPTWDTMLIEEVVWTLEASANRANTLAQQYTVDSIEISKYIFYIPLGGRNTMGEFYARPHNIFYCYDSIASAITDVMNNNTNLFYAIDVEVDEDVSDDLFKMHVEIITYAPILEPNFEPTDFGPGDSYNLYPYYPHSAFQIEKKLNQYYTHPPLNNGYFTGVITMPHPSPSQRYSIIDNSYTGCPNYTTLDYLGSSNLRWLWCHEQNITLNYVDLNKSYHGLRNWIDYTKPSNYKIIQIIMFADDWGYVYDTSTQQSVYGCYPLSHRYRHSMKFKAGKSVALPNSN